MASPFVVFTQSVTVGDGKSKDVRRGINPMLVSHFEETPQGGATLHMMGNPTPVQMDAAAWSAVGQALAPNVEPPKQEAPPK